MTHKKNRSKLRVARGGAQYYKDGRLVVEKTEAFLMMKFLYKTPLGWLVRLFFKQKIAAYIFAWWKKSSWTKREIKPFIKKHSIDIHEFEYPVESFASFNDFFVRTLKKGVRAIDANPSSFVSPCDGKVLVLTDITQQSEFFVKDKPFSLQSLFQDERRVRHFEGGTLALFRLAPYDYHRYHSPLDGVPSKPEVISGPLESVNPLVYTVGVQPLTSNERNLIMFDTTTFASVAFFSVGAMFVGAIHHTFQPLQPLRKGDEIGYFSFGGSSIVMIFERGKLTVRDDLVHNTLQGYETAVKVGERIGILRDALRAPQDDI